MLLGGGDKGSFNSGIVSCVVPLVTVLELGTGSLGSGLAVPLGLSILACRVCFGELEPSDGRGVEDNLLSGDAGRPADEPGASRSFDLPLPKPLNAEPRLVLDFLSGEEVRP